MWSGPLVYMTGVPTEPLITDHAATPFSPAGEPVRRYEFQRIFYERMQQLCRGRSISFIDVCTPFLSGDGFLNPQMLRDTAHIDPAYRHRLLDALDRSLGFVDDTPAVQPTTSQHWVWDGTFGHYMDLAQESVRRIAKPTQEPNFERLVSTGILDSLAVIEMIAVLETTFHRNLDLNAIRRSDFESLTGIYQRFFVDAPGPRTP